VWKGLVKVFNILDNWVASKIGHGNKLKIGEDPWIGCSGNHRSLDPLLVTLHAKGITRLDDASKNVDQGVGIQCWKTAKDLELQDDQAAQWTQYTNLLKHNAICLKEKDDELKWTRNKATGVLTAKLSHKAKIGEDLIKERLWW
jgi:hypothetical protein